jgi:histidyl-tRNA synthetase
MSEALYVRPLGPGMISPALKIARSIRQEGFIVQFSAKNRRLATDFAYCRGEKIKFIIIVAEDEYEKGRVIVRDLENRGQAPIDIKNLIGMFGGKLRKGDETPRRVRFLSIH